MLPVQTGDVRAEVPGTIEQIRVDEGDWVRVGDVIARLSYRENRTALSKTQSELVQMQAQLRLLKAGPRPEEIEVARIGVLRAKERYAFANKNLDRDKQLSQEQLISQKELDSSKYAVVDSEHEVAETKQKLQVLLAGSRSEQIDAIEAGIARLEIQREYLEEQLTRVNVTNSAAGIVSTPSRELKELVGQVVKEGDLIARIHELKTVEVQTPVSEKDIADIKIGQRVVLKARSAPGQTFFGAITSIATTVRGVTTAPGGSSGASTAPSSSSGPAPAQAILVTTRINNEALVLKPGMTGVAKIYCGDRRVFDLVTRRFVRTVKVEFWSWW